MKDEQKLIENLKIIKLASSDSKNLTELFSNLDKVEGMPATARELAYFLQFYSDNFPLANDAMINTAKYIFEMLNEDSEKVLKEKIKNNNKIEDEEIYFDFVLEKLEIEKLKEENKIDLLKYYILDQFLNLVDKIESSDLKLITKDKLQGEDKK